jgi:death-on-curing protein
VRYLTLSELLVLHDHLLRQSGGSPGIRDLAALESAVAQPRLMFGGVDLYPDLVTKGTALAFSLIQNHPFVDGNKRIGHAALETMLLLNGSELTSPVDDAEQMILGVASGQRSREDLANWIRQWIAPSSPAISL